MKIFWSLRSIDINMTEVSHPTMKHVVLTAEVMEVARVVPQSAPPRLILLLEHFSSLLFISICLVTAPRRHPRKGRNITSHQSAADRSLPTMKRPVCESTDCSATFSSTKQWETLPGYHCQQKVSGGAKTNVLDYGFWNLGPG